MSGSFQSSPGDSNVMAEVGNPCSSILTWQGRHDGQAGGFPGLRLVHCTADVLTPAISPEAGNSTA